MEFAIQDSVVRPGPIAPDDPQTAANYPHLITLTLISVAPDAAARNLPEGGNQIERNFIYTILISSNNTDYSAALTYLETALSYLQSNPVIELTDDQDNNKITTATLTLLNLSLADIQDLWSSLHAPLRPFALYSLRYRTTILS